MSDTTTLAELFRRLLTAHHSLCGDELTIDATIKLSDDEFDLVWDELDAIDGADYTLRARA